MKKSVVVVLILLFSSAALGGGVETLSRITLGQIGQQLKTVTSSNNFLLPTTMALRSNNNYQAAANLLTIPLYAYSAPLGIAASAVIGFAFDAQLPVESAYNSGQLQNIPGFNDLMNSLYGNNPTDQPNAGDIFDCLAAGASTYPLKVRIKSFLNNGGPAYSQAPVGTTPYPPNGRDYGPTYWRSNGGTGLAWNHTRTYHPENGNYAYYFKAYDVEVVPLATGANFPKAGVPSQINGTQAAEIAGHLADKLRNDPSFKTGFETHIHNNPNIVQNYPQQITKDMVNNYVSNTTNNSYETLVNNLTNLSNTYPEDVTIKTALEQAKAEQAAQEAEQIKEQNYSPITSTGFDTPYNPGEYDIPARFSSFLNTIKLSGLFSFSSSFFNSLPGGGSPLYEIEAGQYGHHTIDLSQTLTAGLAVLKTILLACFGFLSIRTVIMKR